MTYFIRKIIYKTGGRYFREPEYPGIPASGGLSDQAQG